jgi:hypothetical protein
MKDINKIDYFQSIISILGELPKYKHIDELKKEVEYLIECLDQNQDYDFEKFLDFAYDFIWLVISMGSIKKYIDKISLLCIIHCQVTDIYIKFHIYRDVGEYFYKNWEVYAKYQNVTSGEFIFNYCINQYLKLINKGIDLGYISDKIKKDKYLSSSDGFYTRQAVVLWLYDNIFSKKENSLDFLEPFKSDDDFIRKEINRVNIRNSKNTKSA